jgi:tRNA threonylcarbamoyladenosine biosynthesis protein TsaB
MKNTFILGIETSGITSGVGISKDNILLGEISLNIKNIHSENLGNIVSELLNHCQIESIDIAAIAVSAGPGSFTGLRIGYSLAKGMAHSQNIPIIEVPTLDIWAYQQSDPGIPILAVIDARREELYCARYHWQKMKLMRDTDYQLIKIKRISEILKEKTLVVGGDLGKIKDKLINAGGKNITLPYPLIQHPQGWAFLDLANQKYLIKEFSPPASCEPRYIRTFKGIM